MSILDVNVFLLVVLLIFAIKYWICRKECEELLTELYSKNTLIKAFEKETRPLEHMFGDLTIKRLEEKAVHQIACLSAALEYIPKHYDGYVKLEQAMRDMENFHLELEEKKREFLAIFAGSPKNDHPMSREVANVSLLAEKEPPHHCPLETFIRQTPIEYMFWNECTKGQRNKLEKEYSKLKRLYPEVPEPKLRRTMVYAYNYFKKNIFILKSQKLRDTVAKIINGDEDLGNSEEEVDMCAICLCDIEEDLRATLTCNHFYHRKCIDEWLKGNDNCPTCRHPHVRNTVL